MLLLAAETMSAGVVGILRRARTASVAAGAAVALAGVVATAALPRTVTETALLRVASRSDDSAASPLG
jgi:hypothetical protein